MIDKTICPYRKGSNAYKHWNEGLKAFADSVLDNLQKNYDDGRCNEHDTIMKYVSDYNVNKRKIAKLHDMEKAEFIRDRDLREAAKRK